MVHPGKMSAWKRTLACFLSIVLLAFHFPLSAFAEEETYTGVVNATNVNVRTGPGTSHDILTHDGQNVKLSTGYAVMVHGSAVPDSTGGEKPWYSITFSYQGIPLQGYMRSDYITVNKVQHTPSEDKTFEEQLEAFPESYRASLRAIHSSHPTWKFEAVNTGLDWGTVQQNENVLKRSLIYSSYASYYSTAAGSYDWESDTYFPLEAGTWYQAAPSLVAYYMDPRNFLNEKDLFQFEALIHDPATQTEEAVAQILEGTFMGGGKTTLGPDGTQISYAKAFVLAASSANVSVFHLVTRCIQEVGRNGSDTSLGTYSGFEGYYNFFSIGANTGGRDGMIYAKNQGWDTPYKAILGGAIFISGGYISVGQNTPYFQKFSVVREDKLYWHQYMANIAAAQSEGKIQRSFYEEELKALESAFVFRIPVYENMPESPCAAPVPAGSPNNFLKSLSVEGYSLTPTFDFYESLNKGVSSYILVINADVSSIVVSASAVSSGATVTGSVGTVPIWTGENTLTITCTSASGVAKYYTLTVILNGKGSSGEAPLPSTPEPEPIPSGWNPPYRIQGSLLSGITPGTDINAFLSSLGVYGKAYAILTDENGNAISGGAMRTGMILNYFDGTNTTKFQTVLYGDPNKDSVIDAIDLLVIRRNLLGLTELDATGSAAADVNHDGAVDAIDLLLVRKKLLGLSEITQ